MNNGSDDFSALNMQGDMSQRKTSSGQSNPPRDATTETNNNINILYAILALFIFEIAVYLVREIIWIAILISFTIYVILTGKVVTIFSHFLSNFDMLYFTNVNMLK